MLKGSDRRRHSALPHVGSDGFWFLRRNILTVYRSPAGAESDHNRFGKRCLRAPERRRGIRIQYRRYPSNNAIAHRVEFHERVACLSTNRCPHRIEGALATSTPAIRVLA